MEPAQWQTAFSGKVTTAKEAIRLIAPGRRILIGSGAAQPISLVQAMVTDGDHLADNELVHMLTLGPAPYVARELIVTLDEGERRLVYSVVGGVATHHNASFQVIPAGPDRSMLVWITDMLPDAAAAKLGPMIEAGSSVIKRTLDAKDLEANQAVAA